MGMRLIACGKSNVVLASGFMRMEHQLNTSHYGMSAVPTGDHGPNGAAAVHHVMVGK